MYIMAYLYVYMSSPKKVCGPQTLFNGPWVLTVRAQRFPFFFRCAEAGIAGALGPRKAVV